MKCYKCGIENKEDALFCKNCGRSLNFEYMGSKELKKFDKQLTELKTYVEQRTNQLLQIHNLNLEQQRKQFWDTKEKLEQELVDYQKENDLLKKEIESLQEKLQSCGQPIENKDYEQEEERLCPNCGVLYDDETIFCAECGAKIK